MKIAPSSAATNASGSKCPAPSASEVPTSTGAIAAGSVRTRAAITQMRTALAPPGTLGAAVDGDCMVVIAPAGLPLGPPREPREVRLALLLVSVPALLRLLAHVEEQVRVVCKLLHARETVFGSVEARLQ